MLCQSLLNSIENLGNISTLYEELLIKKEKTRVADAEIVSNWLGCRL